MPMNYLTLAVRNLRRNITFSIINVLGLSLGITAFLLISQYVDFEKSYNSFHRKLPHLYRVLNQKSDGKIETYSAPGFAPRAASAIPGIEQFCRLAEGANLGTGIISAERNGMKTLSFRENNFVYADGNFFSLFSFPVSIGKGEELHRPNTVAISRAMAEKYFGKLSPIGQVITLNNQFGKTPYTVQLVFDDMPEQSDLQYDFVFSLATLANPANLNGNAAWASVDGTQSQWLYTYLELKQGADATLVADQYTKLIRSVNAEELGSVRLQKFASVHLGESLSDTSPTFGSLRFIYLLIGIALLILIIAWFNYVNLSTAGALKRAKEVGIRKVVGASRIQLARQFLGESMLLNALAFVVSMAFVGVLQVPYASLVGKEMTMEAFKEPGFVLTAIAALLIGSILSGAYTAFVLSSFKPSNVLKGAFYASSKGIVVRKSLVVVQFTISLVLIAVTIILIQQWRYMETTDLGINASQLVVVRGAELDRDESFNARSNSFEAQMHTASFVDRFSRSGNVPTDGFNFSTAGITRINPSDGDEKVSYNMLTVDHNYIETYDIPIVAGNNFTPEMCDKQWNGMQYVMLNESAVKAIGFSSSAEAIGQKIKWGERVLEVRGVAKNYHHMSLQHAIEPIVFLPSNDGGYYSVSLATNDFATNMSALEEMFKKSFPGNPFEYTFLDEAFASQYDSEKRYSIVFTIASTLAIFIACLGLLGLAAYTLEQRTKEIGVRRVLGASVLQIVELLTKDFIRLVVIAFVFAVPLAWWSMQQWLEGFAYHVAISWWVFAVAGGIGLLLAFATVSLQSIKGATQNPVSSLRNE